MIEIKIGDCTERLKDLEDNSVDAIICDPPYGLKFMSKGWDDIGNGSQQREWHRGWLKEEFKKINNYNKTLDRCHNTVGVAILNTSITIVFGFSILVLSNFIPTIYFGVFTGLAMLLALISVLTLLPILILKFKPFGEEIDENI